MTNDQANQREIWITRSRTLKNVVLAGAATSSLAIAGLIGATSATASNATAAPTSHGNSGDDASSGTDGNSDDTGSSGSDGYSQTYGQTYGQTYSNPYVTAPQYSGNGNSGSQSTTRHS